MAGRRHRGGRLSFSARSLFEFFPRACTRYVTRRVEMQGWQGRRGGGEGHPRIPDACLLADPRIARSAGLLSLQLERHADLLANNVAILRHARQLLRGSLATRNVDVKRRRGILMLAFIPLSYP